MKKNLNEELKRIHGLLYGNNLISESNIFSNVLKSIGINTEPVVDMPMKADYVSPDVEDFYKTLTDAANSGGLTQQEKGEYSYQKSVESMQIGLDILGYKLPKYGVDGKFGPETAKAVNDFTSENVVDPVFINLTTQDGDDTGEELTESMVELGSFEKTLPNVDYKSPQSDITNDKLPESLLDDLQKAAESMNATVTITRAKSNHKKYAEKGKLSRHWLQQAVDISIINGKSASSSEGKKLFDTFVSNLEKMGYSKNSEYKKPKAVLWGMSNHYDHIHVSNQTGSSSDVELPKTDSGKLMVSEPKKDLKLVTAKPEVINMIIKMLKSKSIDDDDLKLYLDNPKKENPDF
jgi:peptidoglycan hydrolase-like protein with peptidoglycan-binding domain